MRWKLSSHKSLAPGVDSIFWAVHGLILSGFALWVATAWSEIRAVRGGIAIALVCLLLMAVAFSLVRRRRVHFESSFWLVASLDLITIAFSIHFDGGASSNHYLFYFALIPFVAYYRGPRVGMFLATVVTTVYLFLCLPAAGVMAVPSLLFRGVMLALFTAAMGYSAAHIRRSEDRLLNALDKLNERTSELESTHHHLETIYKASHSLAELLAEDDVIDRVLLIARAVLNYPVCEVYTWDPVPKALWLKGRVDLERTVRFERPQLAPLLDPMREVIETGEARRIVDRHLEHWGTDRHVYQSCLMVPMVSQGQVVGVLSAESPKVNAFSERDERVMSVLATSAAMALVNADLHQRMEKLTIIDELTGVYNYRYFRGRLEDEKRRAMRYTQSLALIMVDIDWFKHLNDQCGHETGNVALRGLAQVVASCIRDVDILARYGGEEFIVILPQTSYAEAITIGERIRRRVEQTDFGPDQRGRPLKMTVSIGITSFPENGRSSEDLVETVDKALYRAKGEGRNTVCTV
ncbi:MAG: diguanylate cyclase [candidate division Zixibacteria bacterium]|nr:diguanylate cyclase [candidate division Zixibacteria bacterium]